MTAPAVAGRREVTLPDGRCLLVRRVCGDDLDGLRELFDALSADDRYLRFFSAYCPGLEFFEALASLDDERGVALVAVVDDRIVAEADFHVQKAHPDPELSITVAPDWRGWLGPFLLDALLEVAAERGHPNLEADVMLTNTRMLGLLRARGYSVLEGPGGGTLRVLVGTSGPTPRWTGDHSRRRVLIEVRGGGWRGSEQLREAGFDVLSCPGPPPGHEGRCPALAGNECPLAAEADAVIVALPADEEATARLLAAHQRLHPDVPVCPTGNRDAVDAFLVTIGARPLR